MLLLAEALAVILVSDCVRMLLLAEALAVILVSDLC